MHDAEFQTVPTGKEFDPKEFLNKTDLARFGLDLLDGVSRIVNIG